MNLGVWHPFPAPFESELITMINVGVFVFGSLAVVLGIMLALQLRRNPRWMRLSPTEAQLVDTLNVLLQERERPHEVEGAS
jgi:hypothetical protein